jgi:hypothetical protein
MKEERLKKGESQAASFAPSFPDAPSFSILRASAADFQRDLGRYWRYVRKVGGIALTQQGWIYKSAFKSLMAALNAGDTPADERDNGRLLFMRRLLQAMNELLSTHQSRRLTINPDGRLLGMSMAQRVQWTFEIWRDSVAWNELLRLPLQTFGSNERLNTWPALTKSRLGVLRAISALSHAGQQAGAWVATADLIAHVKRNDYAFLFERRHRGSGWGNFYTSPYYGPNNPYGLSFGVKNEAEGWDLVEGGFIVNVLTGPLYWMGLVELGYQRDGGENIRPAAFRLTPPGAWLIGGGEAPQFIESGGKVIVQPNFTVLALEPVSDAVLNDLDHFAESQGGERAMAYQLTRESLYRAQQSGWDAARVVAFLEAHQGAPIPANVRRSLEEWETTHRRITFHRNVCVVQFADAQAERELADALRPFEPQAIGQHFKMIEQRTADEVAHALRQAGWMPVVQAAGETATRGVLRTNDEGEVTFTQAAPSVYALAELSRFAELPAGKSDDKHKQALITAASVRAAMSAGASLDQLLTTLAELHAGPLPAALEQKIRAWSNFFGHATLQQVTLLELSSYEVLINLLDDREVGRFLTLIEGSSKPLAIVQPAHAETVRAMLRERGINV